MATTANLGLTIPVGGTTPGSITGNTTPGTYPSIESINLGIIDSLCYSANNPVPISSLTVNGNLNFEGFNLTNVGDFQSVTMEVPTATFTTIQGTSGTLTVATSLAAANTGTNVTMNSTVNRTAGHLFDVNNDGSLAFGVKWDGSILASSVINFINEGTALITVSGPAPSPMEIDSNAAATSGTAFLLKNLTTQTSGTHTSFSNNGTQIAFIDSVGRSSQAQLLNKTNTVSVTGTAGLTSPSISTGSGDIAGYVSFTGASHSYSSTNTLFTITFGNTFPNGCFINVFTVNSNAIDIFSDTFVVTSTATVATISVATGASIATSAVSYQFGWMVVGY